jgi:hypothetical protein
MLRRLLDRLAGVDWEAVQGLAIIVGIWVLLALLVEVS